MKILHILDHSLPLHSGYAFRSQSLFRAQRNMGFEPVVVTSPKHEESWKGSWTPVEKIAGFQYYRSGAVSANTLPFHGEFRLMQRLYRRIMEAARHEKPDILHAHSPVLNAIPALWAGKKLNLPVVYEIRAFWEDAAVDHGTYTEGSWKYRLTKSIETWVCHRADHVAILCNGLKDDLVQRGIPAEKITPVFNGIDPKDFKPCPPDRELQKAWGLEGKRVIGFIGSFYRYEGLDLLIKAFQPLADQHPDLILLLVGGGEMEKELKGLATRQPNLNAFIQNTSTHNPQPNAHNPKPITHNPQPTTHAPKAPRILFPGRIPHDRIPGVYALIDILVYPRYSMRLTELVTPLKPLEAMAMGKALVASDVGGHKELITDKKTGLLFSAGNADDLSQKIDMILSDKSLKTALQQQGSQWVRLHHTWEVTLSVYKEIYAGFGKN